MPNVVTKIFIRGRPEDQRQTGDRVIEAEGWRERELKVLVCYPGRWRKGP